jgi:hypothetical protein
MATSTTKLGLIKPDFVDVVDITDLNSNADDIDAAVGFTICTNATRPASPFTGQSIFETDTGDSFIWDGSAWQPGGGGGSIEISATAPASPAAGDLWWDSDNGNLYIYYDDGDSQQWVAANGPQVFVGTAAPAGYQGQLWFDSTTGKVYIYYDDGTSSQWVSAIGGSIAGTVVQVVSVLKTNTWSASLTATANQAVTDLTLDFAVSNASNKLLILANFGVAASSSNDCRIGIAVADDGTLVGVGDAAGSRSSVATGGITHNNPANYVVAYPSTQFIYTPGDTSTHTYTVHAINTESSTRTLYVNRSPGDTNGPTSTRGASSLTIMEVAG